MENKKEKKFESELKGWVCEFGEEKVLIRNEPQKDLGFKEKLILTESSWKLKSFETKIFFLLETSFFKSWWKFFKIES